MSDLWLPPGTRRFDADVEHVIETSDDPGEARRLAEMLHEQGVSFATKGQLGAAISSPDSALILPPRAWGELDLPDGRTVLAAQVESDELRRSILDGQAKVEQAGIADWAEHPMVNALCPLIVFRLPTYQAVTPLEYPDCPAPANWRELAPAGVAIVMEDDDGGKAWLATTAMTAMPASFVLPPRTAGKAGRNDRCPCGSGIKFKRCCGS